MEQNTKMTEIVTDIQNTLINLGTSPSLIGFDYLTRAIALAYENSEYKYQITKRLYPEVARLENTTPSRVERALRHAIETTWERGNLEVLTATFGYTVHASKGKPTNSEFVSMIVLRLEQKHGKCNRGG